MQKLSSLLFTTLISISIVVVAHESMAQTSPTPSKAGTRLITFVTTARPPPRAHRAQSSNLLIVNGACMSLTLATASHAVLRKLASTSERSVLFSSPTITMITRRVLVR